jgi:hypothetical protein
MVMDAVYLHRQAHAPAPEGYQRDMLDKLDINPEEVSEDIDTPDGMP